MKRISVLAGVATLVAAVLGGCSSANMDSGLQALVGQDIHVAIAKLGPPDSQSVTGGQKTYGWTSATHGSTPLMMTQGASGGACCAKSGIGGSAVGGSMGNSDVSSDCEVAITTDANDKIESFQWSGGGGGCTEYSDKLKP